MTDKVLYAELTPQEFRERLAHAPVAYLPLGTLEWHGEHLPLGADGLQSQGFFVELAREVGGIVLPMVFVGPDRHIEKDGRELYGMDYVPDDKPRAYPDQQLAGSAYWVPVETFQTLLEAILKQLARAGFKIVVAHGHGPSTKFFQEHAVQWRQQFGLETFVCWGETPKWNDMWLGIQVDHAAANETSLLMALRPDLVQMERLPAELNVPLVGVGGKDPRTHASVEFGRQAIAFHKQRMAKLLRAALTD